MPADAPAIKLAADLALVLCGSGLITGCGLALQAAIEGIPSVVHAVSAIPAPHG